ncbi:E3 ubiquitin-protein ligase [Wickerhamomyces ciferrii]|uniref:HECT-type E3 ubiquitin transferase n=1 Tax=Wickerhamomyces ciferrii (strain ATCC 14091 / BCRC 22168 / CBS 111 / JCM 3599 / NBRC 0793 / NRRL Y-1031 F-60-10) TaxID=1206466 RepID=K0KJU4_WICCF|nr:E3 ubiquitin-protein ligase [Wickerhamomyces ciferrii]CCH41378.1 E3 ubiquitin-protein ligase [Wickerhamomyces ciferrii]
MNITENPHIQVVAQIGSSSAGIDIISSSRDNNNNNNNNDNNSWLSSSMNLLRFGSIKKKKDIEDDSSADTSISIDSPKEDSIIIGHCKCCGSVVKYPESTKKFKCSICRCIINLIQLPDTNNYESNEALSYKSVRNKIKECQKQQHLNGETNPHKIYKPLEEYLIHCFGTFKILNNSFKLNKNESHLRHSTPNINFKEVKDTFLLILSLPTKKPFMKLLIASNELLLRPNELLSSASDLKWLLILWEIPTLPQCLYHSKKQSSSLDTPEVKSLSYEITKKIIGFISNFDYNSLKYLAGWFKNYSIDQFKHKVEFINLYITFHLTRLINQHYKATGGIHSNIKSPRIEAPRSPQYNEYSESPKLNNTTNSSNESRPSSSNSRPFLNLPITFHNGFSNWSSSRNIFYDHSEDSKIIDFKLKVGHYGNEWHLKSASRLLSVLNVSNKGKIPDYSFYNSLVDYINVKQDFEMWQNSFKLTSSNSKTTSNKLILDLAGFTAPPKRIPQFTICQFPFLLSLGAKISILEYEARRTMENKAEEAFIKALDKKQVLDVHLRIKVRRNHISNDSLRCIKEQKDDLKKSLKVEFIGEPGIDAGGLKKEWFGLLTKELFQQENGMFYYNEESKLCWFAVLPLEKNDELYFMLGAVLGLAIYNSTILGLHFPLALYKKILGKKVGIDDYLELFPDTARGLLKLYEINNDELENLDLFFETTYKNYFDEPITKELIPNGSKIKVNKSNLDNYINEWVNFYLNDSIESQFKNFQNGFHNVIGGNSLSLFSPKEIELLICGNNDTCKIDINEFKSITKYQGWSTRDLATNSTLIKWFWEWFENLNYQQQKKFLQFITGSDRIPATGIHTMNIKITKMPNYGPSIMNKSSSRLPVAHTCFNELCIYGYQTREEMWNKLDWAINESKGFGLR